MEKKLLLKWVQRLLLVETCCMRGKAMISISACTEGGQRSCILCTRTCSTKLGFTFGVYLKSNMLSEEFLKNFGTVEGAGFTEHITGVRAAVVMAASECTAASSG